MTDEEKYLFDLNGYIVVRNAIDSATLHELNAIMDTRPELDPTGRGSIRGFNMLTWGAAFRNLIDNPKVLPYLIELMGDRVRLDHDYAIISEKGGSGLGLHGGGTPYDPSQYYHCYDGKMHNGLMVASYALRDVPAGQGGLAVVPGSHKSCFRLPDKYHSMENDVPDWVRQVPMQAGDCAIFTEALTHGTFPWKADHVRRSLFFKFSPGHMTWAKTLYTSAPERPDAPEILSADLNETQKALLQPPSVYEHEKVQA